MREVSEEVNDAQEILRLASLKLQKNGVPNPRREARILLAHSLDIKPEMLFMHPNYPVHAKNYQKFLHNLERRLEGEPLSKIKGEKEFWGLEFKVTKDTLDPRPDTETLIQAVLTYYPHKEEAFHILDLGTGSGCILISLLKEYPNAQGVAVDISFKALQVAQHNAYRHGVEKRMHLICSDWLRGISSSFDIIVSNPPYIGLNEAIDNEVKAYDPPQALFAGEEGLDAYVALASQLKPFLKESGKIFLEIGYGQEESINKIFSNHDFHALNPCKDLRGFLRCAIFA